MAAVIKVAADAKAMLNAMGTGVPVDAAARSNLIHVTIAEFARDFGSALEDRRMQNKLKIGRGIKVNIYMQQADQSVC